MTKAEYVVGRKKKYSKYAKDLYETFNFTYSKLIHSENISHINKYIIFLIILFLSLFILFKHNFCLKYFT